MSGNVHGGAEARVRQIVADVLGMDVAETAPDRLGPEGWESIQALNIAMAIEQSFGIQLSADELGRMTDLASAMSVLKSRGLE